MMWKLNKKKLGFIFGAGWEKQGKIQDPSSDELTNLKNVPTLERKSLNGF